MSESRPRTYAVHEKRQAKSEAIYDAAAKLFAESGYGATRMEDIAGSAGMSKASLYHYFSSKEELLASLVSSRVGIALEELKRIVASPGSPRERIERSVASHLSVFQARSDVYTIYNTERLHSIDQATAEAVDSLGRSYESLWAGLIEEGIAAGEFRRDVDVAVTVKAVLGACNATVTWFRPGGRLSIDQVAREFSRLILEGLRL